MHTCTFWPIQWRLPWGSSKTNLGHTSFTLFPFIFSFNMEYKTIHSNSNTIVGGFAGGGSSKSTWKKYARHVLVTNLISHGFPRGVQGKTWVNITFSNKDSIMFNPHDNDPLVITVQYNNWNIKWVLIGVGSYVDVLLWDAFRNYNLIPATSKCLVAR